MSSDSPAHASYQDMHLSLEGMDLNKNEEVASGEKVLSKFHLRAVGHHSASGISGSSGQGFRDSPLSYSSEPDCTSAETGSSRRCSLSSSERMLCSRSSSGVSSHESINSPAHHFIDSEREPHCFADAQKRDEPSKQGKTLSFSSSDCGVQGNANAGFDTNYVSSTLYPTEEFIPANAASTPYVDSSSDCHSYYHGNQYLSPRNNIARHTFPYAEVRGHPYANIPQSSRPLTQAEQYISGLGANCEEDINGSINGVPHQSRSYGHAHGFQNSRSNNTHHYSSLGGSDRSFQKKNHQTPSSVATLHANPHPEPLIFSHQHPFIYVVNFKRTKDQFIHSTDYCKAFNVGDFVKVEADRGHDVGVISEMVILPLQCLGDSLTVNELETELQISIPRRCVLTHATEREIDVLLSKVREEERALHVCRQLCQHRQMRLNLLDAELQFDKKKLTFIFTSDRHIDFRELVRDLFAIFKTRIWMHKINPYQASVFAGSIAQSEPFQGAIPNRYHDNQIRHADRNSLEIPHQALKHYQYEANFPSHMPADVSFSRGHKQKVHKEPQPLPVDRQAHQSYGRPQSNLKKYLPEQYFNEGSPELSARQTTPLNTAPTSAVMMARQGISSNSYAFAPSMDPSQL